MTLAPMTCQDLPPLLTLSGAVLEAQWDRVGHITLLDRCRRPVGREKKKKPPCLIFGTRTIACGFGGIVGNLKLYCTDQGVEFGDVASRAPLLLKGP